MRLLVLATRLLPNWLTKMNKKLINEIYTTERHEKGQQSCPFIVLYYSLLVISSCSTYRTLMDEVSFVTVAHRPF